jgi:hypothetical protein
MSDALLLLLILAGAVAVLLTLPRLFKAPC